MPRASHLALALPVALAAVTLPLAAGAAEPAASGRDGRADSWSCTPAAAQGPVCPAGADPEVASFLDPTVRVTAPGRVWLGEQVYVGPFAVLRAEKGAPIRIGDVSNIQDNVRVLGRAARGPAGRRAVEEAGLVNGVEVGERVILAHGSEVRGPARVGVDSSVATGRGCGADDLRGESPDDHAVEDSGVFLSFGALVDGAIIERDSQLSALSRVGPGVRLRSGCVVLPGKSVETQEQADDPALGKVRPLLETDVEFNEAVVEVNLGLARTYAQLTRDDATAVHGISVDPGGNVFDQSRDTPTVESDLCTGPEVREPGFRNRVIGDVCFEDSLAGLDGKLGNGISIRADEGGPFGVGEIAEMRDRVVFHALEHNELRVGDRVTYGNGVIVHGGGRPELDPTTGLAAPTIVGNDVHLEDRSVVFRSLLRNGTRVGYKSAVVGSATGVGQVIPDRTVYVNDEVFGPVEW